MSGPSAVWQTRLVAVRTTSFLRWPVVAGMTVISLSAVFPIYFMAAGAFRTKLDWERSLVGWPTTTSFRAFHDAWVSGQINLFFRNSAIVTGGTIALTLITATFAGYAFAKMSWPGKSVCYFFVLAWMAVPPLILMVPIYVEMVQLHLLNTYWSVIFLYTAVNLPFNCYLMATFFRSVPDELIEAARMDGANIHATFFRVMVPLAKPAIATLCIFNVLYVWNEFLFALLLLSSDNVKTLTVGVLQMQGRFFYNFPALMAGLLIASLPVVGIYLIFQKYLIRAVAAGALK
jgi:ABC-type glycerol-3-phosphate transport system permease component